MGEFGENTPLFPCDVSSDDEIKAFFENVRAQTDRVDLMLHSLAFAPREALEGDFVEHNTRSVPHGTGCQRILARGARSRSGAADDKRRQHRGHDLLRIRKGRAALQCDGRGQGQPRSEHALSCLRPRPEKIRINCISAGPVQTLAARGISGFTSMLKHYQERAPLKRSCDPAELGATGVFLASDGAAAITGQVIYVDGGYQIMGM